MLPGSAACGLCILHAANRTTTPIRVRTPTEPSRDRLQSGPEHGSTSLSVAHANRAADKIDVTPQVNSGRERSESTSDHRADDIMMVPPKKKRAPKATRLAYSDCDLRKTAAPTRTGTIP